MTTTQANAGTNTNPVLVYQDALRRYYAARKAWCVIEGVAYSLIGDKSLDKLIESATEMPTKEEILDKAIALKRTKDDVDKAWGVMDDDDQLGLQPPSWKR